MALGLANMHDGRESGNNDIRIMKSFKMGPCFHLTKNLTPKYVFILITINDEYLRFQAGAGFLWCLY